MGDRGSPQLDRRELQDVLDADRAWPAGAARGRAAATPAPRRDTPRRPARGHRARPRPALGRSADRHHVCRRSASAPTATATCPTHASVELLQRLAPSASARRGASGPRRLAEASHGRTGNRRRIGAASRSRSRCGRSTPRQLADRGGRDRRRARPSTVSSSQRPAVGTATPEETTPRRSGRSGASCACRHRRRGRRSSAAQRSTSPRSTGRVPTTRPGTGSATPRRRRSMLSRISTWSRTSTAGRDSTGARAIAATGSP